MSRRLRLAGLISLALHLLIAAAFLWRPRGGGALVTAEPEKPATVELVMEEQQGAGQSVAQAPAPEPPRKAADPVPPKPREEAKPIPPPDPSADASARPEPPPPPEAAAPNTAATAAAKGVTLQFNLGGTDSDSNATVSGGDYVIPASIDDKARNRPPRYPEDAARAAQQGAVLVMIHVGPDGLPINVEVMKTSGYPSLDRSVREAVMAWHFRPAIKDGQPIPFDIPFRVVFSAK